MWSQFARKLRGGNLVAIENGFVGVADKSARFVQGATYSNPGAPVATSDCAAVVASVVHCQERRQTRRVRRRRTRL